MLGKAPGSPLAADDIAKIEGYVFQWMIKNGYGDPTGTVPAPWDAAIYLQMKNTLEGGLTPLIGKITCDGMPANLEDLPSVKQATPPSDVGQVFSVLLDWSGLGDIIMRGGVLIVILVLLLLAVRRVLD